MPAGLRHRIQQEEGISLVEVLVSILLLGLVLMALGSTLTASMAAARQDESQTHGVALATERLENLQALHWSQVGFYSDANGFRATPPGMGGLATRSLGPTPSPADVAVPKPLETNISRDGRTYTVRTDIVWQEVNRYLRFRVQVDWQDGGSARQAVLEGRRTRRSRDSGQANPVYPFRIESFTINPDPVQLTSTGQTVANTSVDPSGPGLIISVDISEKAAGVTVTWPGMSAQTLTEVAGSDGKRWRVMYPPGQTFPHGYTTFTATATKFGDPATQHTDTTVGYFMYPPLIKPATLQWDNNLTRTYTGVVSNAGDRVCVNGNPKYLQNDYPFWIALEGVNAEDYVSLTRTDITPNRTWTMTGTATAQGAQYYTLVPRVDNVATGVLGAGVLDIGTTATWRIDYTRSYDGVLGMFTFSTRVKGGSAPC